MAQITAANIVWAAWLSAETRLMETAATEADVRTGVETWKDWADGLLWNIQDATG